MEVGLPDLAAVGLQVVAFLDQGAVAASLAFSRAYVFAGITTDRPDRTYKAFLTEYRAGHGVLPEQFTLRIIAIAGLDELSAAALFTEIEADEGVDVADVGHTTDIVVGDILIVVGPNSPVEENQPGVNGVGHIRGRGPVGPAVNGSECTRKSA